MRRTSYTKKLNLTEGSILAGRSVRTTGYSEKLVQHVSDSNCFISSSDVRGWCNLTYVIQGFNKENKTVLLKYSIPNTANSSVVITWPMSGLSKSFGIRI